jgi:hypothetical protein
MIGTRRRRRGGRATAGLALIVLAAATAAGAGGSQAHRAPASAGGAQAHRASASAGGAGALAYSSASAYVIQRQPARGTCHAIGSGLFSRPDPHCTPGALDPAVTQRTIHTTICSYGWTSTVRPPESVSEPEKLASMAAYGAQLGPSAYEYDHLVPLELGGAVNDPRNLWPEPDYANPSGYYLNPKDHTEYALRRLVCSGAMSLSAAQRAIASNWVAAYARYG